jgi:hypothetical protein
VQVLVIQVPAPITIMDRPRDSSALRANSRATRAAAAAGTEVIASCQAGVPGDAASSLPDGHCPGSPARATAYCASSRSNTMVELLGPSPAAPVQLTVIPRRCTRGEELRLPQQRLNRLAAR